MIRTVVGPGMPEADFLQKAAKVAKVAKVAKKESF
jgi:hypothetical protein